MAVLLVFIAFLKRGIITSNGEPRKAQKADFRGFLSLFKKTTLKDKKYYSSRG
jgi:hypothetical protein